MKVSGTSPGSNEAVRGTGGAASAPEIRGKRKSARSSRSDPASAEKVTISPKARDAAKAKQIAKSAPDVNEEKVARLKAAIESGAYRVDADKVADRLVDEHLSTMF